jgi:hypothetical protein
LPVVERPRATDLLFEQLEIVLGRNMMSTSARATLSALRTGRLLSPRRLMHSACRRMRSRRSTAALFVDDLDRAEASSARVALRYPRDPSLPIVVT